MVTVEIGQDGGGFHILNTAEGLALLPQPVPQSSLLSRWDHSTGGQLDLCSFAVQDALPSWLTDNRGGKHDSTLILPRTRPHECCPPPLTPHMRLQLTQKEGQLLQCATVGQTQSGDGMFMNRAGVYGGCNIFGTEATQWRSQLSGKDHREQSIVIMSYPWGVEPGAVGVETLWRASLAFHSPDYTFAKTHLLYTTIYNTDCVKASSQQWTGK